LLYWWIRIYFINIVEIIVLNFRIYISIIHTYKNCINFSIIQQFLIFILTASYISLHLLTSPYSFLHLLTAFYISLWLIYSSYSSLKFVTAPYISFQLTATSYHEIEKILNYMLRDFILASNALMVLYRITIYSSELCLHSPTFPLHIWAILNPKVSPSCITNANSSYLGMTLVYSLGFKVVE